MSYDKNALDGSGAGSNVQPDKSCCASSSGTQKLQPKDELCLSAYIDGECSWLKRIFARRALKSNFEARMFVDELERTSQHVRRCYSSELESISEDVSLWPCISARIEQEERLSLLRSIPLESAHPFSWAARLSWGGMGAVAATLLFMLYLPMQAVNAPPQLASNSIKLTNANESGAFPGNVSQVSTALVDSPSSLLSQDRSTIVSDDYYRALQLAALQASRFSESADSANRDPNAWRFITQQPNLVESNRAGGLSLNNERRVIAPQVFEVDWVRSKGRVKVLQDPSGKAAIIWVNRPRSTASNSAVLRPAANSVIEVVGNK